MLFRDDIYECHGRDYCIIKSSMIVFIIVSKPAELMLVSLPIAPVFQLCFGARKYPINVMKPHKYVHIFLQFDARKYELIISVPLSAVSLKISVELAIAAFFVCRVLFAARNLIQSLFSCFRRKVGYMFVSSVRPSSCRSVGR